MCFKPSTVTTANRCLLNILAPSTGHMIKDFTPTLFILQGDMGGERVLQKKWTTFLKAQLLCSLPDDGFPFNIIQDMFVLTPSPGDWKNTVFYGVFTSQWWVPVLIKSLPDKCSNAFTEFAQVWHIQEIEMLLCMEGFPWKCSQRNQTSVPNEGPN